MTAMSSCNACKFHSHDGGPYGICRRMPPSAGGWPRTALHDWCGEYVAAPVPLTPPKPVMVEAPKPVVTPAPAPARGRPSKK